VEGIGKSGLLFGGERLEPEAAAGDMVGLATDFALPPEHDTRDDLGGEVQRPAGRREVGSTRDAGLERIEVRGPQVARDGALSPPAPAGLGAFARRSAASGVSALLGCGTQRALITRRVGFSSTRGNRGEGGHEVRHA
jgi:hypothetical protein